MRSEHEIATAQGEFRFELMMSGTPRYCSPICSDDEKRFATAADELMATLKPQIAGVIGKALAGHQSNWGTLTCAFVRIILRHIALGYPLAFPPELVAVYMAVGAKGEAVCHECAEDGYCLPMCFEVCPLCGGQVAYGAHATRMGRRAWSN